MTVDSGKVKWKMEVFLCGWKQDGQKSQFYLEMGFNTYFFDTCDFVQLNENENNIVSV